jgi:hypothetical protein
MKLMAVGVYKWPLTAAERMFDEQASTGRNGSDQNATLHFLTPVHEQTMHAMHQPHSN